MKNIIASIGLLFISLFAFAGSVSASVDKVPGPWYLKGNYDLVFTVNGTDYNHTMVIDTTNTSTGEFTGHGWYNPDTSYTWNVIGDITDTNITYTITYTGTNPGYVVNATGTVASDGTLSGAATSNQGQSFTWHTTSGMAYRFTGNHGQWVSSDDSEDAPGSRVGMPIQSEGHTDLSENED